GVGRRARRRRRGRPNRVARGVRRRAGHHPSRRDHQGIARGLRAHHGARHAQSRRGRRGRRGRPIRPASALGLDERSKDAVPYFTAKWEMERAVRSSSLSYVVFRPSFIFGEDGGVLPTFVRLARLAPVTPIVGDGKTRLQPIWVEDVAEYYARAIDHPAAA